MDEANEQAIFEAASERGRQRGMGLRAIAAHYDAAKARIIVELSSGAEVSFPPSHAQGLEGAGAEDLSALEITPSGLGLHFPKLDADIYIPSLIEGILGSASWMAASMGKTGGAVRSPAKAQAARENGKKGGRPRKSVAA